MGNPVHKKPLTSRTGRRRPIAPTLAPRTLFFALYAAMIPAALGQMANGNAAPVSPASRPPATQTLGPQAPERMTAKAAARNAVESNPEVQARWHALRAAAFERDVANGARRPRIDFDAGAGKERRDSPLVQDTYSRFNSTLSLTQLLYDGWLTSNEVKRLDHAVQTRLYELLDASETAALEAVRAYIDVQRHKRLVELAEDNYVNHKVVLDQIQKKVKAGVGRGVDLETAGGRLALAEANLLTEIANLHDVSTRYQRIVGMPPPAAPETPAGLEKNLPGSRKEAVILARERHPGLLASVENVRASEAAVQARRAAYQPRVDFRLRHDDGRNLNGSIGSHRADIAELVLNFNLYRGGSDDARVAQAIEEKYVARDVRDKTCRDVRQTIIIAHNDATRLVELMTYLERHQLAVEKAQVAFRRQFEIGQRGLLDLLDTENELFQAKRAHVNAENDLKIAQARTHAGVGGLLKVLGLSRALPPDVALADERRDERPADEVCPPDAYELRIANKQELDERAAELGRLIQPPPAALPAAAPPPAVAAPRQPAPIVLASSALFDFGRAELLPAGKRDIDTQVLARLKEFARIDRISITGHTDPIGNHERNLRLSQRRADAVKAYLVANGVAADVIETRGLAATALLPNVSCQRGLSRDALAACLAPHRRIEVNVEGMAK